MPSCITFAFARDGNVHGQTGPGSHDSGQIPSSDDLPGQAIIQETASLTEGKLVNGVRGESVANVLVGAAPVAGDARIVLDTHRLSGADRIHR